MKEITIKNVIDEMTERKRTSIIFVLATFIGLLLFYIIMSIFLSDKYSYDFGAVFYSSDPTYYSNGDFAKYDTTGAEKYIEDNLDEEYLGVFTTLSNRNDIDYAVNFTDKISYIDFTVNISILKADYEEINTSIEIDDFVDEIGDLYLEYVYPKITDLTIRERFYGDISADNDNLTNYAIAYSEISHLLNITSYLSNNFTNICNNHAHSMQVTNNTLNNFSGINTETCETNFRGTLSSVNESLTNSLLTLDSYGYQILYEKSEFGLSETDFFKYLVNELTSFQDIQLLKSVQEENFIRIYKRVLKEKIDSFDLYYLWYDYESIDFSDIVETMESSSEIIYKFIRDISSYAQLEDLDFSSHENDSLSIQMTIIILIIGTFTITLTFYTIKTSWAK